MSSSAQDIDLSAWVGKTQEIEDSLSPVQVRQMAAAFDDPQRLAVPDSSPLPAGWHWLYFNPIETQSRLGQDGHPLRGDFLPPVQLERRMWAGSRLHWLHPMHVGMRIKKQSKILKVDRKTGRSGEMVFVTVAHRYLDGQTALLEEEHDIVYRGMPSAAEADGLQCVGEQIKAGHHAFQQRGEHIQAVPADSVLLFRYSAATFNGHRIHYDVDYCREVEGYPGLVVHGPLIATLLLTMMTQQVAPGQAIARFEFRALNPTFALSEFHLHATQETDKVWQLWSTTNLGQVGLNGRVVLA